MKGSTCDLFVCMNNCSSALWWLDTQGLQRGSPWDSPHPSSLKKGYYEIVIAFQQGLIWWFKHRLG